jgi:hypothetical protein
MRYLISKNEKMNIVRLLSELYTNTDLGVLIHGDESVFNTFVDEFINIENLKKMWWNKSITQEGRYRVLLLVNLWKKEYL